MTVAVIDTGVDPHPDLRNNLLKGTDVAPGGSGNGQEDADSHGTGMAGLIAAHGRHQGTGALGVAPKAKILPVRDSTPASPSNGDRTADGVDWAVANGASIINISSAGGPTPRLRASIEQAIAADVIVVAGAGNTSNAPGIGFPAMYEGTIAVGATDTGGNYLATSATGPRLTISAPGIDIVSTSKGESYRKGTGTSGAAAIVSGAAALVRSKFPELSAKEVVHRLTATAVDKGPPGRDEQYGYGVLDLVAALTADVPPLGASADPSVSPSPSPSRSSAAGQPPGGGSSGVGGPASSFSARSPPSGWSGPPCSSVGGAGAVSTEHHSAAHGASEVPGRGAGVPVGADGGSTFPPDGPVACSSWHRPIHAGWSSPRRARPGSGPCKRLASNRRCWSAV
nr:S8 family serine peptidase [Polymorphospora rubra]